MSNKKKIQWLYKKKNVCDMDIEMRAQEIAKSKLKEMVDLNQQEMEETAKKGKIEAEEFIKSTIDIFTKAIETDDFVHSGPTLTFLVQLYDENIQYNRTNIVNYCKNELKNSSIIVDNAISVKISKQKTQQIEEKIRNENKYKSSLQRNSKEFDVLLSLNVERVYDLHRLFTICDYYVYTESENHYCNQEKVRITRSKLDEISIEIVLRDIREILNILPYSSVVLFNHIIDVYG